MKLPILFTALPTPFLDGKIDFDSLKKLIEYQILNGADGLVIAGSTGEYHALSLEEYIEIIKFTIKEVNKRVCVVVGASHNITSKAIEITEIACKLGADMILSVVPYYNKPQPMGIYMHFKAVNDISTVPIMLYNVPSRTGIDISVDTCVELAKLNNIRCIKDAKGSIEKIQEYIIKLELANISSDKFTVISGDDDIQAYVNMIGAQGVVSVASNVFPKLCLGIQKSGQKQDHNNAVKLQQKLLSFSKAIFFETSPSPIKYCLKKIGIFKTDDVRLPLVPINEQTRKILDNILSNEIYKEYL